jgi:hypothetical protein
MKSQQPQAAPPPQTHAQRDHAEYLWWQRQTEHETQMAERLWDPDAARAAFRRGLTPRAAAGRMPARRPRAQAPAPERPAPGDTR